MHDTPKLQDKNGYYFQYNKFDSDMFQNNRFKMNQFSDNKLAQMKLKQPKIGSLPKPNKRALSNEIVSPSAILSPHLAAPNTNNFYSYQLFNSMHQSDQFNSNLKNKDHTSSYGFSVKHSGEFSNGHSPDAISPPQPH